MYKFTGINLDHLVDLEIEVISCRSINPEQLEIAFSNGKKLIIIDDDDMYECCAISPNIYI